MHSYQMWSHRKVNFKRIYSVFKVKVGDKEQYAHGKRLKLVK